MAQKPHSLEGTWIAGDHVRHYTCNPPSSTYLNSLGITQMGIELGCEDPREVLLIPKSVYQERGFHVKDTDIGIISESLMRNLTREEKKPLLKRKKFQQNPDEVHICDISNKIEGVYARLATPEEDCGYQKADVIILYHGQTYPLQVSYTPKSKGEHKRLMARGTTPISTHRYPDLPYSDNDLVEKITKIISSD